MEFSWFEIGFCYTFFSLLCFALEAARSRALDGKLRASLRGSARCSQQFMKENPISLENISLISSSAAALAMVCSAKMNHTRKREASEPEKWQKRDLSVLKTAGRLLLASSFRAASLVTGWLAVSEKKWAASALQNVSLSVGKGRNCYL